MKKITAVGLSILIGGTAIASAGMLTRKAILSKERAATESPRKGVKLPVSMKGVSKRLPKGMSVDKGVARVGKSVDTRLKSGKVNVPSEANIYGWLGYYADDEGDRSERGLARVNFDGTWTPIYSSECISLGMGVKDGVAYAQIYNDGWDGIDYAADVQIDIATGEIISEQEIDMETEPEKFFFGMAYDMEEMKGYGYHVVGDDAYEFAVKDLETGVVTGIAESENLYKILTFNPVTGEVVCIDLDTSTLVGINPSTGEETVKGTIDIVSDYVGGLCYSPKDNAYIWNPNAQDWSYLVKVSDTGATEKICDVQLAGQYQAMYCVDQTATDPAAPARPVLKDFNFKDGSLSGNVVWSIPSQTEGGSALTGDVDYKVTLNGAEFAAGKTAAGSDLSVEFKDLEQGTHTFKIQLSADGKEGRALTTSRYVGNDTPKAPASVTLTDTKVEWEAVTEGMHLGYLDLAGLRYNVRLNGVTIAEGVEGTSCATGLDPETPIDNYVAEVEAVCNGLTSAPASSNGLIYGAPLKLPVSLAPTEAESQLFTVIDGNEDEETWTFENDEDNGDCFMYHYSYMQGDDWLILPPFKVEDTQNMLYFAMQYAAKAANMPEDFEVKIGKSPTAEDMTTLLFDRHGVANTTMEVADKYFTVDEPGTYYIGIHAMSEPDMFYLFVKNFLVEQSDITMNGPAAVKSLSAEPGASGALTATVSFVMPDATIAGAAFPADVVLKAYVNSGVETKSVTGAPGSTQTVTVATEQGNNEISVQTEADGKMGAVERVSVYTGLDIPGIPTNIKAAVSEDNYSATISWSAPTEGENGGYVAPTGIKYVLCQYTVFGWMPVQELGTDVFEYKVGVPDGSPLDRYDLGILCENEAGSASYLATIHPVLGKPYDLPAVERFAEGNFTYTPVSIGGEADPEMSFVDSSDLDEEYAGYTGTVLAGVCYDEGVSELFLPKFSTKGVDNAAFEIGLFMRPGVKVYAEAYGVEKTLILDLPSNTETGYKNITCPLPASMQNNGWVSFSIVTDYAEGDTFILTGYRVRNLVDHDLSVSVAGNDVAALGENLSYVATITNEGTQPTEFTGGKWTVRSGDKVIAEKVVSDSKTLQPDEKVSVEFETTADASYIGEVKVEFALAGSDDNVANDAASLRTVVSRGEAVVVTDLDAVINGSDIQLTWSAPLGKPTDESFEDETPFVLSPEKIGAFKNVDLDGGEVYTWEDGDRIWDGAGKPGAFSVFSASQLEEKTGNTGMFEAADGDKFLLAFCPIPVADGGTADAADDWLISPECEGGSEFSFALRSLTEQYGAETLEVLVAKDASEPSDFTLLESISVCSEQSWEYFSFRLTEDMHYFAIRYTSEDIFGVMLDAIRFQPIGSVAEVAGYDIWRSEGSASFEQIAHVSTPGYVDSDADVTGMVSYYVVPVMNDGANGEKSNIAIAHVSGVNEIGDARSIIGGSGEIRISGFAGKEFRIVSVSGVTVASGVAGESETVALDRGIYIVNVAGRKARVLVR